MEVNEEENFPWIKDVVQSFAASFMTDYDNNTLSILHRNIDKEITITSRNVQITRAKALYKEMTYLYEHMRLKINQHPDFQNATLSCVKLISQLIRVGLILTKGVISSEWIQRILTALKLFPGKKVLLYDALLLVNNIKKIYHKPYSAILRNIMTEDHHEFVTDPLVYMEIILLFRRLKALVLDRYKEKYTILAAKIKPPTNLISWLASLDDNVYSPYLKKLKYKKIALLLMKKILPESFIKKIKYMALNQYNFEVDVCEFKMTEAKEQSSKIFVIDNVYYGNLDKLMNSQKASTKKAQAKRKRQSENILNDKEIQLNTKNKVNNYAREADAANIDLSSNKHVTVSKKKQKSNLSNSNERIIVSKKKIKSKHNLVKNVKSKTSVILNEDVIHDDLFSHAVEGSTSLQLNKNTLNDDSDSSCEIISIKFTNDSDPDVTSNKNFPNAKEHIFKLKEKVEAKSKKKLLKNTKSRILPTLSKDIPDSNLFLHDVEISHTSEQLYKNIVDSKETSGSNVTHYTHSNDSIANEHITKKKKSKSKCILVKNNESISSSAIPSKNVSDDALFFLDVEGNRPKKEKETDDDSELSENAVDSVIKNVLKRKIKKRLKSLKNNETAVSDTSVSCGNNLDSNVEFHEDAGDSVVKSIQRKKNKKRLKLSKNNETVTSDKSVFSSYKLDSSVEFHEKTGDSVVKNVPKKKHRKRHRKRFTKNKETATSDKSVSSSHKLDSSPSIKLQQQITCKNKSNKQENSFKNNENGLCATKKSGKKRKKIPSNDELDASDDKGIHLKKLMLEKVSEEVKTKVVKDSSILETTTQTTQKNPNEKMIENVNSKWRTLMKSLIEDNEVINKQTDILLHKSDSAIPLVSNLRCNDKENEHNIKESGEILPSDQTSVEELRLSAEYSSIDNVSRKFALSSQSLNDENHETDTVGKEVVNHKCMHISASANLSNKIDHITTQKEQMSDQSVGTYVVTNNTLVDATSCKGSSNLENTEILNNSSVKNLSSSNLDELRCKTNLKLECTLEFSKKETQKTISITIDNLSCSLDSVQSEKAISADDNKNAVNKEFPVENSSVFESKLRENTAINISPNVSLDETDFVSKSNDTTLNEEIPTDNIFFANQEDKNLQIMQSNKNTLSEIKIDRDSNIAEDSESCTFESEGLEASHIQSPKHHSKKMKENYVGKEDELKRESTANLNSESEILDSKIATFSPQTYHDSASKKLSIEINACDKEDNVILESKNYENTDKKYVERTVSQFISEMNQENKFEKKDASALDKENDEKILPNEFVNETDIDKNMQLIKNNPLSQNSFEKPVEECPNGRFKDSDEIKVEDYKNNILSDENIEENLSNENAKISANQNKNNLQIIIESEKYASSCENPKKVNIDNSQSDILKDTKISSNQNGDILQVNIESGKETSSCENSETSVIDTREADILKSSDGAKISLNQDKGILQVSTEVDKGTTACENSKETVIVTSEKDILKNSDDVEISANQNKDILQISVGSERENSPCKNSEKTIIVTSEGDILKDSDRVKIVSNQNKDILQASTESEKDNAHEIFEKTTIVTAEGDILKDNNGAEITSNQNGNILQVSTESEKVEKCESMTYENSEKTIIIASESDILKDSDGTKISENQNEDILQVSTESEKVEKCESMTYENSEKTSIIASESDILKDSGDAKITENKNKDIFHISTDFEKDNAHEISEKTTVVISESNTLRDNDSDKISTNQCKDISQVSTESEKECETMAYENSENTIVITSESDILKDSDGTKISEKQNKDILQVSTESEKDNLYEISEKTTTVTSESDILKTNNGAEICANQNKDILQVSVRSEKENNPFENSEKTIIVTSEGDVKDSDRAQIPSNQNKDILQASIESEKDANACKNFEKTNIVNSSGTILKDSGKLSNENVLSSNESTYSASISNSVKDAKTPVKGIQLNMQELLESEKILNLCDSFDKSKSANFQDKSIIHNEDSNKKISLNDGIAINHTESTSNLLPNSENSSDSNRKSDCLETVNSQDNDVIDNKNDLSNENILSSNKAVCFDSISKSKNKDEISVKEKEDTLKLSLESKSVEKTLSNTENVSSIKTAEVDNSSLHSTQTNSYEYEKSPKKISKDNEQDLNSNSEFQEKFTIIDGRDSDIEDCKSNSSEHVIESNSSLKAVSPKNKSKFKEDNSNEAHNPNVNLHENCTSSMLPVEDANKSKFKSGISCSNDSYSDSHQKDTPQIEPILKVDSSEALIENCKSEIDNTTLPTSLIKAAVEPSDLKVGENTSSSNNDCKHAHEKSNEIETILEENTSKVSLKNYANEMPNENPPVSSLSITDDIKHTLDESNLKKEHFSNASVVQNCSSSSTFKTETSKKLDIKYAVIAEQAMKRIPAEDSEFVPSFCDNKNYETFSEISFQNKDKNIDVKSIGTVPINNFSSSASTELFSLYRNKLLLDDDKTDVSLSSRDGIFSNCQENDEKNSQSLSSDLSEDDIESRCSSLGEEGRNAMEEAVSSEDFNAHPKQIDESPSFKNSVISPAKTENDSVDNKNYSKDQSLNSLDCNDNLHDAHAKMSTPSILPRQSVRIKTKAESKCQVNSEESSISNNTQAEEIPKKGLKLVLIDCESTLKSDNSKNLCKSVENVSSCPVTPDKNKDIISSPKSAVKKDLLTAEGKQKNFIDCSSSDKRYSLRLRKPKQSRDDSANLGIDLNKLKFDSPSSKCTRSRRESKFVKLLTSNVQLHENASDVTPTKRETRSSTAKSDIGSENTPCYNLRNRRSLIAPPKLNV